MARLCLTFVLSMVLLAAVVSADQGKVKKVAGPKCDPTIKGLNTCCNEKANINEFFSLETKTKCKSAVTHNKYVNEYKLQDIQKSGTLPNGSLTAEGVTKFSNNLENTGCYIECLFKESKLMTSDGLVNATLVKTYFNVTVRNLIDNNKKDKPSSDWIQNASIIAAACAAAGDVSPLKNFTRPKATANPSKTCSVYPLFTMQCFHWVEFFLCPASAKISPKNAALCSGTGVPAECNTFDILTKAYGGSSSANFTVMFGTNIKDKLASLPE